VEKAFQQIEKELGKIDVFVSNAAYLPAIEGLSDGDGEEVRKGLEVNVLGNLNLASALVRNGAEGSVFVHVSCFICFEGVQVGGGHMCLMGFRLLKRNCGKTSLILLSF